jgi:hypothetical protein
MYAAGHPPLSGFELESFADKMPRHWKYPSETPGDSSQAFVRTRNLLAASVVALRTSVELAVTDATAPKDENRWPELARFECFACHHDLDDATGRGEFRPGVGVPGRPQLMVGCMPLVAVAAHVAKGSTADKDLAELAMQLQAPFERDAFGDPADLQARAPAIVGWCRSVEETLDARPLTAAQATAVLHAIANEATSVERDFDTARQLFGAWKVVYRELAANHATGFSPDAQRQVEARLERIEARDPFFLNWHGPPASAAAGAERDWVYPLLMQVYQDRVRYDPAEFARFMRALDELTRQ